AWPAAPSARCLAPARCLKMPMPKARPRPTRELATSVALPGCGARWPGILVAHYAIVSPENASNSAAKPAQGTSMKHVANLRNDSRAWIEGPADDNGDAIIAALAA